MITTDSPSYRVNLSERNLYLHIGHGKTGSSTIQHTLRENISYLRKKGFLLADQDMQFPTAGSITGHPLLFFRKLIEDPSLKQAKSELHEKIDSLLEIMSKENYHSAIISSENLWGAKNTPLFIDVGTKINLHIIYYIRRQDDWIASAWKQWGLKSGQSLSDFAADKITNNQPDFLRNAKAWQTIATSISVIPINSNKDVTTAFWECLNIPALPVPNRRNQTFDASILNILSHNPYLFEHLHDNQIFNLIEALLPEHAPRKRGDLLHAELSKKILAHFSADNQTLQEEFFPHLPPLNERELSNKLDTPQQGGLSIERYLGFELLMLQTLYSQQKDGLTRLRNIEEQKIQSDDRIHILEQQLSELTKSSNKRIDSINKNNQRRAKINQQHEKQLTFLNRKIEEIEQKMARSLKWRIKKITKKILPSLHSK